MSSSDTETLVALGNDLITNIICVTTETVLITVYAILVAKAASTLLRKKNNKASVMTLAVVIVMFLMALVLWIIDLVDLVGEARITLIQNPDIDIGTKYGYATDFVLKRAAVEDIIYAYMTIFGDAVVIWRTYAFWASDHNWKLALVLPITLLVGSIGTSVMLTYCVVRVGAVNILFGSFSSPAFCKNAQTASYAMPAATTFVSTALIGIKAWRHIKIMKIAHTARISSRKTKVEQVMVLLIESGLLYFLFFMDQVIMNTDALVAIINASPSFSFATTVFQYLSSSIVGIYPTAIICIVHSQCSTIDSSETTVQFTLQGGPTTIGIGRRAPPSAMASDLAEDNHALYNRSRFSPESSVASRKDSV